MMPCHYAPLIIFSFFAFDVIRLRDIAGCLRRAFAVITLLLLLMLMPVATMIATPAPPLRAFALIIDIKITTMMRAAYVDVYSYAMMLLLTLFTLLMAPLRAIIDTLILMLPLPASPRALLLR